MTCLEQFTTPNYMKINNMILKKEKKQGGVRTKLSKFQLLTILDYWTCYQTKDETKHLTQ